MPAATARRHVLRLVLVAVAALLLLRLASRYLTFRYPLSSPPPALPS